MLRSPFPSCSIRHILFHQRDSFLYLFHYLATKHPILPWAHLFVSMGQTSKLTRHPVNASFVLCSRLFNSKDLLLSLPKSDRSVFDRSNKLLKILLVIHTIGVPYHSTVMVNHSRESFRTNMESWFVVASSPFRSIFSYYRPQHIFNNNISSQYIIVFVLNALLYRSELGLFSRCYAE